MKQTPRRRLLRALVWGAAAALFAPLAFGVAPPPEALQLPEVVVRGIDRVRLEAQREGVVPLEPARAAQTAPRVELPTTALPTPALEAAPPVQSPGCAYRNSVTGALARASQGPEALYKTALERLSRDQDDEAAFFLARLRADHSEHPSADAAAFWLGEINRRKGRLEEALAFFRLVHGTYRAEARYRTAWLLESAGRREEALSAWAEVARDEANPHREEGLYRLGVGELVDGHPERAAASLEAALASAQPGAPADADVRAGTLLALGLARRAAGDPAGAEKALLRFLLERPDHPAAGTAQGAMGWALLDQGKAREAALRFQWVLDGAPSPELKTRALYGRLRAEADLGRAEAAARTLAALEAENPPGAWLGWARADVAWLAFRQGRYEDSLAAYRSALAAWQGTGQDVPRYMIGECLYLLGRYVDAAAAYQVVEERSPLRPAALHRAGMCALLAGDDAGAAALFGQVLEHHPGYPETDRVWAWLGEARLRLGERDAARQAFGAVPDGSPAYAQALYGRAWIAFEADRWSEAADLFGQFLARFPADPNHDEALLTLARTHFNRRELRAALAALDRLEAEAASDDYRAAARFYRGWMLARSRRAEEGRAVLRALVAAEPQGPYAARAHETLGWLDYTDGSYDEALAHFEAVLALEPGGEVEAEARQKRADSLYNLGRYEDALAAYAALGDTPVAQVGEALCLQRLGRTAALAEAADRFASNHPQDPRAVDLYFALGEARTRAGDPAAAALAYRRAAALAAGGDRAAEANFEAARAVVEAGDVAGGAELLRSLAAAGGPMGLAARKELARVYEEHGTAAQARDAYDEVARATEGEERCQALRSAARSARVALDWDGARERLTAALAACPPDDPRLRQALLADLGEVLVLAGEPAAATGPLGEAAELGTSPDGLRAFTALGRAQEAAGQTEEALETYLRIGYLYPVDDPAVARSLMRAGALLEAGGDAVRARAVYEKVAAQGPAASADEARSRMAKLAPAAKP